jgi:hypothetical protein
MRLAHLFFKVPSSQREKHHKVREKIGQKIDVSLDPLGHGDVSQKTAPEADDILVIHLQDDLEVLFAQVLGLRIEKKEKVLVLEGKPERETHRLGQPLQRVLDLLHARLDQMLIPQHLHLLVGEKEHIVLGRNVVVELTHGHPGGRGNLPNSRSMIPLFEEESAGGVHDLPVLEINEIDVFRWGRNQIVSHAVMDGFPHGHPTSNRLSALCKEGPIRRASARFIKTNSGFPVKQKKGTKGRPRTCVFIKEGDRKTQQSSLPRRRESRKAYKGGIPDFAGMTGKRHASVVSLSETRGTGLLGQLGKPGSGTQTLRCDEGCAQGSGHVRVGRDNDWETAHNFEGFHKS